MRPTFLAAALAGAAALAAPAQAQNTQIGTLNCDVSGGLGLIIASQKEMVCTFRNSAGQLEAYTGVIQRFGLDVGATQGGTLVWSVIAPSGVYSANALAGVYTGASAQATVAVGLGANVLVSAGGGSVALQPLSVQGQTGLNLAVGVASLELRGARLVR
jgi:hypothetical protein